MLNRKALVSAVSLGLTIVTSASSAQDSGTARILVEGPENRVYEFHQNLKTAISAYLVDSNFGTAGVACSFASGTKECETLDIEKERPIIAEYYTFSEPDYLTAFLVSWRKLQTSQPSMITIQFGLPEDAPDCSTAPQPCVSAYQCVAQNPRRCDEVKGPPCTSCNN